MRYESLGVKGRKNELPQRHDYALFYHEYIYRHPGHSGVEIVNALKLVDGIEERTVRTSLNRLKNKWGGLIENRRGKWYSVAEPLAE